MTAQVITGNRLSDGRVVFLGTSGWVEDIQAATLATSEPEVRALEALGRQAEAVNEVVGPYLVEVVREAGRIRPSRLREHLRTQGPSIRPDLGRQALARGDVHVSV